MKYVNEKCSRDSSKFGDFSDFIPNASRNEVSSILHLVLVVLLGTTRTEILLESLAWFAELNVLRLLSSNEDTIFDASSSLQDRSASSFSFFKQLWKIPAQNNRYNFNS